MAIYVKAQDFTIDEAAQYLYDYLKKNGVSNYPLSSIRAYLEQENPKQSYPHDELEAIAIAWVQQMGGASQGPKSTGKGGLPSQEYRALEYYGRLSKQYMDALKKLAPLNDIYRDSNLSNTKRDAINSMMQDMQSIMDPINKIKENIPSISTQIDAKVPEIEKGVEIGSVVHLPQQLMDLVNQTVELMTQVLPTLAAMEQHVRRIHFMAANQWFPRSHGQLLAQISNGKDALQKALKNITNLEKEAAKQDILAKLDENAKVELATFMGDMEAIATSIIRRKKLAVHAERLAAIDLKNQKPFSDRTLGTIKEYLDVTDELTAWGRYAGEILRMMGSKAEESLGDETLHHVEGFAKMIKEMGDICND